MSRLTPTAHAELTFYTDLFPLFGMLSTHEGQVVFFASQKSTHFRKGLAIVQNANNHMITDPTTVTIKGKVIVVKFSTDSSITGLAVLA